MNFRRIIIALILLALGIAIPVISFEDMKIAIKNERINLNTASQSDFDKKALVEGEINFVYGPFATYEEEHKSHGITTSKKETNYYIIGNFTKDDFFNDDMFFVIFSTADKDMIKKLDNAAEKWIDFFTSEDENVAPPETSIKFDGKLWTEPTDSKYVQYRNSAFDDLEYLGIDESLYAKLKINEGSDRTSTIVVFFGAIIAAIVGLLLLVVPFIKSRKKANEEFY